MSILLKTAIPGCNSTAVPYGSRPTDWIEHGMAMGVVSQFYLQIVTTLYSEKNTHSHFLSYLHQWCVDLNKNCSEYTQGMVDSENVKITDSLRLMTSLLQTFNK